MSTHAERVHAPESRRDVSTPSAAQPLATPTRPSSASPAAAAHAAEGGRASAARRGQKPSEAGDSSSRVGFERAHSCDTATKGRQRRDHSRCAVRWLFGARFRGRSVHDSVVFRCACGDRARNAAAIPRPGAHLRRPPLAAPQWARPVERERLAGTARRFTIDQQRTATRRPHAEDRRGARGRRHVATRQHAGICAPAAALAAGVIDRHAAQLAKSIGLACREAGEPVAASRARGNLREERLATGTGLHFGQRDEQADNSRAVRRCVRVAVKLVQLIAAGAVVRSAQLH
eukprot:1105520-Prymnesium_polylepis.1